MNEIAFFFIIVSIFTGGVIVGSVFLKSKEKQKENETDWEQVKIQASISAMQSLIKEFPRHNPKTIADWAEQYADKLVDNLKIE